MRIDSKGRCCGRKPMVYKREPHMFCPRCDRAFDPKTGEQIENWAYTKYGAPKPQKANSDRLREQYRL